MTPQQAPSWPIARHAALSGRATALNTAQSSSGGRYRTRIASTISVPSVFFQSVKRLRFSHGSDALRGHRRRPARNQLEGYGRCAHRSRIWDRRLYRFMISAVSSDIVR